tara:strand:+ start:1307 stop:1519 length:213 start_codon:yes stop_codon:yes gene_type:complete
MAEREKWCSDCINYKQDPFTHWLFCDKKLKPLWFIKGTRKSKGKVWKRSGHKKKDCPYFEKRDKRKKKNG